MKGILAGTVIVITLAMVVFAIIYSYRMDHPKPSKPEFVPTFENLKCNHTWKPFPWYCESIHYTDTNKLDIQIYKPYVCIHCKEVNRIRIERYERYINSSRDADEALTVLLLDYENNLKPRAIVEEMIADMQLVDEVKLKIAEELQNPKGGIKVG